MLISTVFTSKVLARKVVVTVCALSLLTGNPVAAKSIAHKQDAKDYAKSYMKEKYGWGAAQFQCTNKVFEYESHWNYKTTNGKYLGIPQVNSGFVKGQGHTKSAFMKDYKLQVRVGLTYIKKRYGTPCKAWSHIDRTGWY